MFCVFNQVCGAEDWTCRDGSCIPIEYRCDNQFDCPDYTDEENCPPIGERVKICVTLRYSADCLRNVY